MGLAANSSTENEIAHDGKQFPKFTWFRNFRLSHDDETKEDILMQDNKICALMRKNYSYSTGKGSKDANVSFFALLTRWLKRKSK